MDILLLNGRDIFKFQSCYFKKYPKNGMDGFQGVQIFGVPKHSELEPDYWLAKRDGNTSQSGRLG